MSEIPLDSNRLQRSEDSRTPAALQGKLRRARFLPCDVLKNADGLPTTGEVKLEGVLFKFIINVFMERTG